MEKDSSIIEHTFSLNENNTYVQNYANLGTTFERVITLGYKCIPKGHVNAFFNKESDPTKTKKGHADLFDWMEIQDYNLFSIALQNKLTDFFEIEDFDITKDRLIVNKKYKMIWWHIVHSDFDGHYVSDIDTEKFKEVFPVIKNKINYLQDRFINAKNKKTLYILTQEGNGISEHDLLNLRDSLEIARDGNKEFSILFVPQQKTYDSFDNIIVRESNLCLQLWHGGNQDRWDEILSEFQFSKNIWD